MLPPCLQAPPPGRCRVIGLSHTITVEGSDCGVVNQLFVLYPDLRVVVLMSESSNLVVTVTRARDALATDNIGRTDARGEKRMRYCGGGLFARSVENNDGSALRVCWGQVPHPLTRSLRKQVRLLGVASQYRRVASLTCYGRLFERVQPRTVVMPSLETARFNENATVTIMAAPRVMYAHDSAHYQTVSTARLREVEDCAYAHKRLDFMSPGLFGLTRITTTSGRLNCPSHARRVSKAM